MRLNKFCITYFLLLPSTLFSCDSNLINAKQKENSAEVKKIEMNLGEGNLSFTTTLNISNKKTFKTKANADGVNYGNYDNVDIFITKNQANPLGNIDYTHNLTAATIIAASGTIQFTFKGLKPNTTYYLGAKALNGTSNITVGGFALSPEILVTAQDGSIATLQNDSATIGAWDIAIKTMPSEIGAKIDSNITINDGKDSFSLKEQLVNTQTLGKDQKDPAVFINNLGSGLSVFIDNSNISETAIRGTFMSDYLPNGRDFRIDSTGGGVLPLSKPTITINDEGYGMVLWNNATQINYTHIKNYQTSFIGSEVNQIFDNSDNPQNPKAVMQKTGNIGLIIYQNSNGIVGKVLDGSGAPNFSGSVTPSGVLSIANSGNINPDVTGISNSTPPLKAFVVWNNSSDDQIKVALLSGINATTFNQNPSNFTVNQNNYTTNKKPKVSVNALGDGLIVWQANNISGENRILCRRIENGYASGNSILSGSEFKADPEMDDPPYFPSTPPIDQTTPSVFVDNNGNGIIAWVEKNGASFSNIKGIRIHNYTPTGRAFKLNAYAPMYGDDLAPNISVNEKGTGNVVWEGTINNNSTDNPDIYSIRLRDFYPQ